jgi:GxxExxY protein
MYINFDDKNKTATSWSYTSADIEKLTFDVIESARNIFQTLKPGLPRCVYQLKLYNDLLKKGFHLQTETSALSLAVSREFERELIIVNGTLVIECTIENETLNDHRKRVMFDLENNGYTNALLLNFAGDMHCEMITVSNHHSVFH